MPSDESTSATAIVAIDTSVLLRFLDLDRTDLLKRHPFSFVTTGTVKMEIAKGEQLARYGKAKSRGHITEEDLSPNERNWRDPGFPLEKSR